jgi:hypothetical protein
VTNALASADPLESAARALARYRDEQDVALAHAARALSRFRETGLSRFNLFRIADVRVNENQFTEALAALLDPEEPHGLGNLCLRALVRLAGSRAGAGVERALLSGARLRVRTQRPLEETTPDIVVSSRAVLVMIEHKVRRGRETVVNGEPQTVRQHRRLLELADERGIPRDATLGILLSPDAIAPAKPEFVAMRTGSLLAALTQVIRDVRPVSADQLHAFIELWEEYNG